LCQKSLKIFAGALICYKPKCKVVQVSLKSGHPVERECSICAKYCTNAQNPTTWWSSIKNFEFWKFKMADGFVQKHYGHRCYNLHSGLTYRLDPSGRYTFLIVNSKS